MPCGVRCGSEVKLVAHQHVSESRVRVWRPLSRSLPLAHLYVVARPILGGLHHEYRLEEKAA
jgi:hypothetical protein